MNDLQESRDYVLQACREHDVKFIRLWFTDILGSLKSFAITVEELRRRSKRASASTARRSRASRASTSPT